MNESVRRQSHYIVALDYLDSHWLFRGLINQPNILVICLMCILPEDKCGAFVNLQLMSLQKLRTLLLLNRQMGWYFAVKSVFNLKMRIPQLQNDKYKQVSESCIRSTHYIPKVFNIPTEPSLTEKFAYIKLSCQNGLLCFYTSLLQMLSNNIFGVYALSVIFRSEIRDIYMDELTTFHPPKL